MLFLKNIFLFLILWSVVFEERCPKGVVELEDDNRTFSSPGFDGIGYPNLANCVWRITAPKNKVTLYDQSKTKTNKSLRRGHMGSKENHGRSVKKIMNVQNFRQGTAGSENLIPATMPCLTSIVMANLLFTQILNTFCNVIQVVVLVIKNYQIESAPDCLSDRLMVHDGRSFSSPVLASVCGTGSHHQVESKGAFMLVALITDEEGTDQGFRASYYLRDAGNQDHNDITN